MNMHVELQKFEPSSAPAKPGLLRLILAFSQEFCPHPRVTRVDGRVARADFS